MIIRAVAFASLTFICACTSQAQLDNTAPQKTVLVASNYQAVFKQLNRGMRNCAANAFRIDAQLYPDLGHAEITLSADGLTSASPFLYAKIIREGAQSSVLELKSLMGISPEGPIAWMEFWAAGGTGCPGLSYAERPPQ
ncbi:hypothetical protein [Rhodobacter sp. TJ_12]|uniref:hypothetical protein n=1 Tax=Rhodobacter sp. TJ_12 TaxID=2029399 RepID=UPI001CBFE13A|nr:hypothetical protein [Rhodobacter sp. TJ_12]